MSSRRARAFAPMTVGNVAVGFDILGLALDVIDGSAVGDTAEVERIDEPRVELTGVTAPQGDSIPTDPKKNTATVAVEALRKAQGIRHGFRIVIKKGIPLSSGMGGSAASAVAAVVAANHLLDKPLSAQELLPFAVEGEGIASGTAHADNVAPCLLGGLVLAHPENVTQVMKLRSRDDVSCVLVHPHLKLETKELRGVLSPVVPLKDFVGQTADLAFFLEVWKQGSASDLEMFLKDRVIEPQRARFIPGIAEVKKAALDHGAWGCSISGAGPSLFALCERKQGAAILTAMKDAFQKSGRLSSDGWVCKPSEKGARILS